MSKTELKSKKLSKYIMFFSVGCFVVSVGVQIFVSNNYAVRGVEMVDLQARKASLEKELLYFRLKASDTSSLADVERRARELGFVDYIDNMSVVSSPRFAAVSKY